MVQYSACSLTSVAFRHWQTDTDGLRIVATSQELTDFAFMTLTKDELASGLEGRMWLICVLFELSLTQIPYNRNH